jgi:hypothetical protein
VQEFKEFILTTASENRLPIKLDLDEIKCIVLTIFETHKIKLDKLRSFGIIQKTKKKYHQLNQINGKYKPTRR